MKKRILCAALAVVMLLSVLTIGPLPARAESNMTVSDQGEAMIKAFEGFSPSRYDDNGRQQTVGWGCGVTDEEWAAIEKNPDGTITVAAAQALLDAAMLKHGNEVNAFADKYGLTLTQGQFDALTSLSFNIGGSWMRKTDWHIFKAVTSADKGAYLAYAFALYSTSGGVTTQGHLKRRLLELQMFLYDTYDVNRGWPEALRYVLLDGNGGTSQYNPHGFNINHPISTSDMWVDLTAPTGKDGAGNPFTYQFAGWFTKPVGGEQVLTLDASMENGMILYAHWKNPTTGQIEDLQPGTAVDLKVKATSNVTMREGPCTYYTSVRTAYSNELLHITRVTEGKDGYQWGLTAEGWVRLDHTNYGTTGGGSGNVQAPGTYATVTTPSGLKIRTGPATSYSQVGTATSGTVAKIVAQQAEAGTTRVWGQMENGNWICLEENGKSYVTLQVITDNPEQSPGQPVPDVSGAITVASVEVKALPTVVQYALCGLDRVPDLTGGRIRVRLSNGVSKWIDMTRGMISGFDNTKIGTNTVTVSVGGKSDTFTVEIIPVNISGIAMENYPSKVQYRKDMEQLDLTGVTITVNYSPFGTESVAVTPDMVSGFDNTVSGTQTVVVTYKGHTTSFYVEVVGNDPQGISMATLPNKRSYRLGVDALDLTGAAIQVTYSLTGPETIPVTPDMVTGFDNTTTGKKTLTVTYQGLTTTFDVEVVSNEVQSISMAALPNKLTYRIGLDALDLTGAAIQVTYSLMDAEIIPVTAEMVTGFDNSTAGVKKLTVTYKGASTSFDVEITIPTVTFRNFDGSVLSQNQYLYGAVVTPPENPTRPAGDHGPYTFVGWDKEITACDGDAVYTAVYKLVYPIGDVDRNMAVNEDDAIYLLRHVVFPEKYPMAVKGDYDKDGDVDGDDAIYLLRHVIFPEKYPL